MTCTRSLMPCLALAWCVSLTGRFDIASTCLPSPCHQGSCVRSIRSAQLLPAEQKQSSASSLAATADNRLRSFLFPYSSVLIDEIDRESIRQSISIECSAKPTYILQLNPRRTQWAVLSAPEIVGKRSRGFERHGFTRRKLLRRGS